MAEHNTEKVPITDREYLWAKNVDTGEVALHVGPTQFQPSAADRIVIDDGKGGFMDAPAATPRKMVEVSDGQYAVIFNPVDDPGGEPNGKFKEGKNTKADLKNGTKSMVPGPCSFYLRPGQRCEVRDAHRLEANEFVVVEVQGKVDVESPYYSITAKAAKITTAIDAERDGIDVGGDVQPLSSETLRLGQRIVITGLATNFYIPPSGIDVVPDTSIDSSGKKITPEVARRMLKKMKSPASSQTYADAQPSWAVLPDSGDFAQALNVYASAAIDEYQGMGEYMVSNRVDQSSRKRHAVEKSVGTNRIEEYYGASDSQERRTEEARIQLENLMAHNQQFQEAVQREARKSALVRRAVVLSEKEFCVLIDENGKRQVKKGPARVFPGPYDRFQTEGSRNRIYDAYELLPQRALWLRVLTRSSREDLSKKLPEGVVLEKDVYNPGDELLVHKVSAFFFPFDEVEVLDAEGKSVVGNDHSTVLIEEIGIDQKSGIYVRDLMTGEVKLVRGKQSYLVDPRKEVQIFRDVSAEDWNLMIGEQEPHKLTTMVVRTPWALSITIPHNMAVLATSAGGQRVIEGPCVELLEYEEKLAVLKLSKGRPKDARNALKTCFLRVRGNRVSDEIRFKTYDSVPVRVVLSYTITFLEEHQKMWFNHMNYVQLLVNQLRSLLRGNLKKIDFLSLEPRLEDEIRDIVLGVKNDEIEGSKRPGRTFDIDNGMHVLAVDVIEDEILDKEIAERMRQVQRTSVTLRIGDREAEDNLKSQQLRASVADQSRNIDMDQFKKSEACSREKEAFAHERSMIRRDQQWTEKEEDRLQMERQQMRDLQATLARKDLDTKAHNERYIETAEAEIEATAKRHLEEQTHTKVMTEVEMGLIKAHSDATVAERQAVQPGLIEALSGFGEAHMIGKAAENMGLISLVKGQDMMKLLEKFFGNNKAGRMVKHLQEKYIGAIEEKGGNGHSFDESTR